MLFELNLRKCADTLVGDPEQDEKTLSGGERKRLALAVEMIVNPAILFLDEPTSGLDSYFAESVMTSLKSLAKKAGKTVVLTVHQPSSIIYAMFDRLLLLSNGKVCYHGDTNNALRFFASPPILKQCSDTFNPADFFLQVMCSDFAGKSDLINQAFVESDYGNKVALETETVKDFESMKKNSNFSSKSDQIAEFKASSFQQLKTCSWRAAKVYYRDPKWIRSRISDMLTYPIIFGLCYVAQTFGSNEFNPLRVSNMIGSLSALVGLNAWGNVNQYISNLPSERGFYLREIAGGLYKPWVYFAARQVVELPFMFFLSIVTTTIAYLMPGLWQTNAFIGWLISMSTGYMVALAASSIGYMFGFLTENYNIINSVCMPAVVAMMLCNGFWLNNENVPEFMSWLPYISFFYYGNENVFVAVWDGVELPPCANQTQGTQVRCFESGEGNC